MPPRTHRDAGPTSDAREPAAAPVAAAPRTPAALITRLQQGVGNAAVAAYLARQEVSAPAMLIDALRELLDDGDEEGALPTGPCSTKDEAATALGMAPVRTAAVDTFDDEEMAQGIKSLEGGSLVQKLNWLSQQGSTYELVRPPIARTDIPPEEKTAVYSQYLRDFFVGLCDNEQMADAVKLLGGTVTQKLEWMIAEGTSGELVFPVIGLAPVAELYTDSPLPKGWNGKFQITNAPASSPSCSSRCSAPATSTTRSNCTPPVVREDAANWYAGPNVDPLPGTQDTTDANTAAHEFGHLVGLADEYNLTAADYEKFTGAAPRAQCPRPA